MKWLFVLGWYIAIIVAMYQNLEEGIPLWVFLPTVALSAAVGIFFIKRVLDPLLKRINNKRLGEE